MESQPLPLAPSRIGQFLVAMIRSGHRNDLGQLPSCSFREVQGQEGPQGKARPRSSAQTKSDTLMTCGWQSMSHRNGWSTDMSSANRSSFLSWIVGIGVLVGILVYVGTTAGGRLADADEGVSGEETIRAQQSNPTPTVDLVDTLTATELHWASYIYDYLGDGVQWSEPHQLDSLS